MSTHTVDGRRLHLRAAANKFVTSSETTRVADRTVLTGMVLFASKIDTHFAYIVGT